MAQPSRLRSGCEATRFPPSLPRSSVVMHTVPLPRHRACRIYVGYFHPLWVRRSLMKDCSENRRARQNYFTTRLMAVVP